MKKLMTLALLAALALGAAATFNSCSKSGGGGPDDPPAGEYLVTLTPDPVGGGSVGATVGGTAVTSAAAGAIVTITATTNPGFTFGGWTVTAGGVLLSPNNGASTATFTMPAANVGVRAAFAHGIPVTSVTITSTLPAYPLVIGQTYRLTATVLPTGATDKTLTWTSNQSGMLAVDEATGMLRMTEPMKQDHTIESWTPRITATANDGSGKSASIVVNVSNAGTVLGGDAMYSQVWATGNSFQSTTAGNWFIGGSNNYFNGYNGYGTYMLWGLWNQPAPLPSGYWPEASYPCPAGWWLAGGAYLRSLTNPALTSYEWVRFSYNPAHGAGKFTDKVTGRWILLPAGGYNTADEPGVNVNMGSAGYYWGAETAPVNKKEYLYFDSGGASIRYMEPEGAAPFNRRVRFNARCMRPIVEAETGLGWFAAE